MSKCYCGSDKEFSACCEPYISGKADAPSAIATMRARYSSFVVGNIDYVQKTHNPGEVEQFNREETEAWSKNSQWKGLEIIESDQQDDENATVEFVATYVAKNVENQHHEVATFQKIDNFWYFMDGEILRNAVKREGPKIGRNDSCPCGSGKKFKKCCI